MEIENHKKKKKKKKRSKTRKKVKNTPKSEINLKI